MMSGDRSSKISLDQYLALTGAEDLVLHDATVISAQFSRSGVNNVDFVLDIVDSNWEFLRDGSDFMRYELVFADCDVMFDSAIVGDDVYDSHIVEYEGILIVSLFFLRSSFSFTCKGIRERKCVGIKGDLEQYLDGVMRPGNA